MTAMNDAEALELEPADFAGSISLTSRSGSRGRSAQRALRRRLCRHDSIVVEAGTHDKSVRLRTKKDLVRLTGTLVANLCDD
jgi:hypothetical protein